MTMVRHIALFLALAIATIAVSLTPSAAQAHDGHRHGGISTSQHAPAAAMSHSVTKTATIQSEARIDCNGPCCAPGGHHGSCCCATGLAAAPLAAATPPMASALSRASEPASLAGIVLEALPEPPKPFA